MWRCPGIGVICGKVIKRTRSDTVFDRSYTENEIDVRRNELATFRIFNPTGGVFSPLDLKSLSVQLRSNTVSLLGNRVNGFLVPWPARHGSASKRLFHHEATKARRHEGCEQPAQNLAISLETSCLRAFAVKFLLSQNHQCSVPEDDECARRSSPDCPACHSVCA